LKKKSGFFSGTSQIGFNEKDVMSRSNSTFYEETSGSSFYDDSFGKTKIFEEGINNGNV
jgi:hypothetical protein